MTETQKAIEAEAEKIYPFVQGETGLANLHNIKMRASISAYIAGRSKSLERERELEEALRDLYNAIDSLPNWKKRDTLAQHCDMEKAKKLLNNH